MPKTHDFSDPNRMALARELKKEGKSKDARIWTRIGDDLLRSRKNRSEVNLWKICKHTKKDDVVVVPGKVLGNGMLDHRVTVAAWYFSENAKRKISKTGGEAISITELIKKNPTGSGVMILG